MLLSMLLRSGLWRRRAGSQSSEFDPDQDPAASEPAHAHVECLVCGDLVQAAEATCAGADGGSSSGHLAGCHHYLCSGCLVGYLRSALALCKYPVQCPGRGGGGGAACSMQFSGEAVRHALRDHPGELQRYDMLEVEGAIDARMCIHCPHKSCSALLMCQDDDDDGSGGGSGGGGGGYDQPFECPACHRAFCIRCGIPGWHTGYTCAQYQALPLDQRCAEDAPLLALSAQQHWKQCPRCRFLVERVEGCNHMTCRCGSQFCYACGKGYEGGLKACRCPLFDVPDDRLRPPLVRGGGGAAGAAAAAAAGPEQNASDDNSAAGSEVESEVEAEAVRDVVPGGSRGARPERPWRNGRLVSRTRCRFAASIDDCPRGLRCWFRHDEDGEF
ncbi:hypothetical protein HYH02_010428 [Chlamydomonas schloesseri]|uniref:RBR-type E3 ubiquitin transferase n=1 Tax=Chlamydomonas schloesseri TaxID=2026947 RepID=A0A835T6T7_9CHLO|nr:hypothetical protein HYH02_010428 [Chlamydomonas schloesseri]|eukprot:KAG2439793.1 hypothetical protein HYH02_010428 [Chlamydomonas schloesseri]